MSGALSAGLLVAGLCSIPVGAWIDRGHARLLDDRRSLLAAVLMFAWSRVESLAMSYVVWLGPALASRSRSTSLRGDHARLRPALPLYIMVMTSVGGLASTFGIPFAQLLIERIDWRPTPAVLAAIPRRRLADPRAVCPRPEARPRSRSASRESSAASTRLRWRCGCRRSVGYGRLRRLRRARLLGDSFHLIPAVDVSARGVATRRGGWLSLALVRAGM